MPTGMLCLRGLPSVKSCIKATVLIVMIMQVTFVILSYNFKSKITIKMMSKRDKIPEHIEGILFKPDLLKDIKLVDRDENFPVENMVLNRALQQKDYSEKEAEHMFDKDVGVEARNDLKIPAAYGNAMATRMRKRYSAGLQGEHKTGGSDTNSKHIGISETHGNPKPYGPVPPANTKVNKLLKPLCSDIPESLVGRMDFDVSDTPATLTETAEANPSVKLGGEYMPYNCTARHKVAIIIPHRSRESHLRQLLAHLHPVLQRQQISYRIFVSHQAGDDIFNKAKVMNAGFLEALKMSQFDCVIFHDVDLLPEDDRLIYSCINSPTHMSVAIDKYKYKVPYASIFGGVTAFTTDQFQDVNGFSNKYWGWGGEDDDIFNRVFARGYTVFRPPLELARYKMSRHERDKGNRQNIVRYRVLLDGLERMDADGLNSIDYLLVDLKLEPLYTNITVDVGSSVVACKPNTYKWVCNIAFWLCERYEKGCYMLQHNEQPPSIISQERTGDVSWTPRTHFPEGDR